jgi:hypothetical protein
VLLVLVVGIVLWREGPGDDEAPAPIDLSDLGALDVDVGGLRDHGRSRGPVVASGENLTRPTDCDPEDLVFRADLEDADGASVAISLDGTGRVVAIVDDGFRSPDDLRTLVPSAGARARLVDLVVPTVAAAAAPPGSGPAIPDDGVRLTVVLGTGELAAVVLDAPPDPRPPPDGSAGTAPDMEDVAAALVDRAWLDAGAVEPEGPWVPPAVEVTVRNAHPEGAAVPWPAGVALPEVPEDAGSHHVLVRDAAVAPVLDLFAEHEVPRVAIGGTVAVLVLGATHADEDGC